LVETSGIFATVMNVHVIAQAVSSPACHCGGPVSIPVRSVWCLWRTQWHWDRFFLQSVRFPRSVCSILILLPITPYNLSSW